MLSRSLITARRVVIAGAVGLAAFAAVPGVASADTAANPFGSLGSLSGVADNGALGKLIAGSVADPQAGAGSVGSVAGAITSGSVSGAVDTIKVGSSTGSAGSLGQYAGVLNGAALGNAVTGSLKTGSSQENTGSLKGVTEGSVTGALTAGSSALTTK